MNQRIDWYLCTITHILDFLLNMLLRVSMSKTKLEVSISSATWWLNTLEVCVSLLVDCFASLFVIQSFGNKSLRGK